MLLPAARGSQPERVLVYVEARGCSRERPRLVREGGGAAERGVRKETGADGRGTRGARYVVRVRSVALCAMWCVVVCASAPGSRGVW